MLTGGKVGGEVNIKSTGGSPISGDAAGGKFGCPTGASTGKGDGIDTVFALGTRLDTPAMAVGETVTEGTIDGLELDGDVGMAVGPAGRSIGQTAPSPLNSNDVHRGMFASNCSSVSKLLTNAQISPVDWDS